MSLRNRLNELASSFAESVLAAIRAASIEDLYAGSGGGRRPARAARDGEGSVTRTRPGRQRAGRLARRSPADIAKVLSSVVALVKKQPKGLRAEQIRAALKMRPNEMPRVLKEGLAKKQLKSKGQKRATTYFAA